jgi:hypothetical protein
MIARSAGDWHHVWVGVELGTLRHPSDAAAVADIQSFARAETREMLSVLHRPDGTVTAEIRYWRSPTHDGLRAAVLARVDGRSMSAAADGASRVVARLVRCPLIEMVPLGDDGLLSWLRGSSTPARWRWIVERRMLPTPAPLPATWCFRSAEASNDGWRGVLDSLLGIPAEAVLGVRVRGIEERPADDSSLESLQRTFDAFAVEGWDEGAAALGQVVRRDRSSFAVDASAALRSARQHRSWPRFRVSIGVHGSGEWGTMKSALESLVPPVPARPASAEFGASPLHVLSLHPSWWDEVGRHAQSLDFDDPHGPVEASAPLDLKALASTFGGGEAASLFHLPRAGQCPTPGFRVPIERMTGIPDEPFVFLSYNRVDQEVTRALRVLLDSWGMPVWWDARIVAASDWSHELSMVLGHRSCAAVVVVLTERTAMSQGVAEELATARRLALPVIQVGLRPSPPLDSSLQFVDLVGWTGGTSDGRIELLRRDLGVLLSGGRNA